LCSGRDLQERTKDSVKSRPQVQKRKWKRGIKQDSGQIFSHRELRDGVNPGTHPKVQKRLTVQIGVVLSFLRNALFWCEFVLGEAEDGHRWGQGKKIGLLQELPLLL